MRNSALDAAGAPRSQDLSGGPFSGSLPYAVLPGGASRESNRGQEAEERKGRRGDGDWNICCRPSRRHLFTRDSIHTAIGDKWALTGAG